MSASASMRASSKRSSTEREHVRLRSQRGNVLLGLAEAVLEGLEHRLDVGQRRAQVVARPGDELPASVEEPLQARAHLVERPGEIGDFGRAVLRGLRVEVSASELRERRRDAVDRVGDRPCHDEGRDDRGQSRRGGDGQDLDVVAHVEHDPAREEHGSEREHGEHGQAGELEPQGREEAETQASASPTASVARATMTAVAITDEPGSRPPRPSVRGAGLTARPRASRAACGRAPAGARVERRRVSPDARHQLVAGEDDAPGWLARNQRRSNSSPSAAHRGPPSTRRASRSRGRRRSRAARRRPRPAPRGAGTLFTRAASSRGENGFVTQSAPSSSPTMPHPPPRRGRSA